jgi:N-succinyl-L-ornithine transcarbamylase
MHCLPVRRDVELSSKLIDHPNSLIQKQATNRIFAAQVVLKNLLENSTQANAVQLNQLSLEEA